MFAHLFDELGVEVENLKQLVTSSGSSLSKHGQNVTPDEDVFFLRFVTLLQMAP